jgi:hypothetical protein
MSTISVPLASLIFEVSGERVSLELGLVEIEVREEIRTMTTLDGTVRHIKTSPSRVTVTANLLGALNANEVTPPEPTPAALEDRPQPFGLF